MQIIPLKIPRRKRHCDLCTQSFAPQSTYDTVLVEKEEGWDRRDFCSSCWNPELKQSAKSHWRAIVPRKIEGAAATEETFLELIDHLRLILEKASNPSQAFILALYLARKKLLQKRQEVEHDGVLVTLYEVKGNEEILAVPHIDITTLDAASLQEELQTLLQGK